MVKAALRNPTNVAQGGLKNMCAQGEMNFTGQVIQYKELDDF
jgi:hypothetical protein